MMMMMMMMKESMSDVIGSSIGGGEILKSVKPRLEQLEGVMMGPNL
jgi:hypothetical protein